jgi:hypothetical protein
MERMNWRPLSKTEKRLWDLRHKPWGYEYKVDPAPLPEMVTHEKGGLGWFLLALVCAILDLPVVNGEDDVGKSVAKYERPEVATAK